MHVFLSAFLLACLLGSASARAQWSYHGLGGVTLSELLVEDGFVYAATGGGVFKKAMIQPDTSWTLLGFRDEHVRTVAILNPDTMIAAVHVYVDDRAQYQELYRTFDGGASWSLVASMSGEEDLFKVLRHLPHEPTSLLAGGFFGTWKSTDLGSSWTKIAPASDIHFFTFDPLRTEVVWTGGESNILWPYLMRSPDSGDSWQRYSLDFGGDNAVYDLAIDPINPDLLYIGTEGSVFKSEDGVHWRRVLRPETGEYFLGLAVSPNDRSRVYASGIRNSHEPQRPTLYVSDDFAESWSSIAYGEASERFAVVSLAVSGSAGFDTVFLGTWRDGVYSYGAPVGTAIDDDLPRDFRLEQNYPNPFNPSTSIAFELERSGPTRLRVFDAMGRHVDTLIEGIFPPGTHEVAWNAAGRPAGMYLYQLEAESRSISRIMVLIP